MNIQLTFTDKEIAVIELMAPPLTATEVCNKVMRDWFTANSERMYKQIKPENEKLDEIITAHSKKVVK